MSEFDLKIEGLNDRLSELSKTNFPMTNERTTITWYMLRLILEFGNRWEEHYEKLSTNKNRVEIPTENEFFTYINNKVTDEIEESVNNYWKQDSELFINILSLYRNVGAMDSNIVQIASDFAKNINNDPQRYIYEIMQNADDCDYSEKKDANFTLDLSNEGKIVAEYNEEGMTYQDIISLTTIGQSNKRNRVAKRVIGEKGIGFKTIFSVCSNVVINSGGYSFQLNDGKFSPKYVEPNEQVGTKLELTLKQNPQSTEDESLNISQNTLTELMAKYGVKDGLNKQHAFKHCPVLFTNRLKSITLKDENTVLTITNKNDKITYTLNNIELDEIEYYRKTKPVEFTFEEYSSRYKDQYTKDTFPKENDDKTAITYDIEIVAPKDVTEIREGNLYSFLPTSTNIKAPFNLQIPLKLNLDRSSMWFKGDQDTNGEVNTSGVENTIAWNNRLISETYGLIEDFYNKLQIKDVNIFDYTPSFNDTNQQLFKSEEKYAESTKKLNDYCKNLKENGKNLFKTFQNISYFKAYTTDDYYTYEESAMFDEFVMKNFQNLYYDAWNPEGCEQNLVEFNAKMPSWCDCMVKIADDSTKETILNQAIHSNELRDAIFNLYKEDSLPLNFLPKSPNNLEIFKVRRLNNTHEYIKYDENKAWLKHDTYRSSDLLCFVEDDSVFEKYGLEWTEVNAKFDIFSNTKDKVKTYENLKELMSFFDNNWFEYTRKVLTENVDGWKNQKTNLAKLIRQTRNNHCNTYNEELQILGVLAHGVLKDGESYQLPHFDNWTEEFCKELNSLEYCSKIKFVCSGLPENNSSIPEAFKTLPETLPKVVNVLTYSDLPVAFVRFAGTVILRESSDEIIKDCINSMREGLGFLANINKIIHGYKTDGNEIPKLIELKNITNACIASTALDINGEQSRKSLEYDVLNELLQNANDKVSDGLVNIEVNDNEMILSYNESSGFLLKDFLAVSSLRNSGNKDDENRGDSTGHKGTGFKGVYKWFKKVDIYSNGIHCELDDTKTIESDGVAWEKIDNKDYEIVLQAKENPENPDGAYPIPVFVEDDTKPPKFTKIVLTYRDDFNKSDKDVKKNIENGEKHLFLFNIDTFDINGTKLDKKSYVDNKFYKHTYEIPVENDKVLNQEENKPQRFKNFGNNTVGLQPAQRTITVLFPTVLPANIESNLYVGLPVGNCSDFNGKFYINCPLFELEDNRKNLHGNTDNDYHKWNERLKLFVYLAVLKGIEGLDSAIAYKYFPFHHLSEGADTFWSVKIREVEQITNISFIRTVTSTDSTEFKMMSINDFEERKFELLPKYMYQAIKSHKKPYSQDTPFVYYDEDDLAFFDVIRQNNKIEPTNDETPFYKWALGENRKEPVYTKELGDKLGGFSSTSIVCINSFEVDFKKFFEFNDTEFEFDEVIYKKCFENVREKLYTDNDGNLVTDKDGNLVTDDEIINYAKQNSKILYEFQDELDDLIDDSILSLIENSCIAILTTTDECVILDTKTMYWTENDFITGDNIYKVGDFNNAKCLKLGNNLDKTHEWNDNFYPILEMYNNKVKSEIPDFRFEFKELSKLGIDLVERLENNIPKDLLDIKGFSHFGDLSMLDILKTHTKIYDSANGRNHNWTFGYSADNDSADNGPYLILFKAFSLQKLLKEFFNHEGFVLTKEFTKMVSLHPTPQFKNWDTFDYNIQLPKIPDDTEEIKSVLVKKCSVKQGDAYRHFAGYGTKKECPICKGKLMAEMTQLRVRNIKLVEGVFVPVVCCLTCADAFSYTHSVYVGSDDNQLYQSSDLQTKLKGSANINVCFELSNREITSYELELTPLHRKWMLEKLEKRITSDLCDLS